MKVMDAVDALGRSLQEEWWCATDTQPLEPRAMVAAAAAVVVVPATLWATGLFEVVAGTVLGIALVALIGLAPFVAVDETVNAARRRRRRRFEANWPELERISEEPADEQ